MPLQAWSIDDVRAAEAAAMEPLPEGELMARAAHGLSVVCAARLEEMEDPRVVALVGPGGNGGDALFAAARLARIEAADVRAVATTGTVHEPAGRAAREAGVDVVDATDAAGEAEAEALAALADADLVLDGMTGIGGRPGLGADEGERGSLAWRLVCGIGDDAYVVAVDVPSGVDPSGEGPALDCVYADETVTFGVAKPVHVLAGSDACGLLSVVDIGLVTTSTPAAERLGHDDAARLWPVPGPADDKYSRGVVGIVAGGENYTGAALLATTGALCAGPGMIRYVGPATPASLVRAALPEVVHGEGRVQAWVVGPGLDPAPGPDDEAGRAQVDAARRALESAEPCVVDAGGLDLLDGPRPHAGARTLLTPHAGELARLLTRLDPEHGETSRADVEAAPVEHARRAARLARACVLLKGATTFVVPPVADLPVRGQADGPPWLATAGAGDVLAGIAGTLLAAGLDPLDAGSLAALVHGLAAAEANPGGPIRALEVAHAVPGVVAGLLRRPAPRPRA